MTPINSWNIAVLLVIRPEPAKLGASIEILIMFALANSVLWLSSSLAGCAVILSLRHHFSAEARETRRRARSHGPVVSRKHGPSVRLAVNVNKPKRKQKR